MIARTVGAKACIVLLIVTLLVPTAVPSDARVVTTPGSADGPTPAGPAIVTPPVEVQAAPPALPVRQPPPPAPSLVLAVRAAPEEVPVDGVVTLTVRLANVGDAAAGGVVISGTLPAGLQCPRCRTAYDSPARQLQWDLPTLAAGQAVTHTFAMRVPAAAAGEGGFALTLAARGQNTPRATRSSAVVKVPYPVPDGPAAAALAAGQEGRLVSADGRLTVTFPLEAVGTGLTVAYTPTQVAAGEHMHLLRRFHIEAHDPSYREVHTFTHPLRIAYRYTWAEVLGLNPAEDLFLARWDEELQAWVKLPSEVDEERQLLVGWTDHFSEIGGGYIKLPSDDYMPAVQGFQEIDLFSGAASYSYPIELPPGRGGFGPQLSLSYSSASIDWPASPWNPDDQAGWVGHGWSLEPSYVGRQDVAGWRWHEYYDKDTGQWSCEPWYKYTAGDAFNVVLNGSGNDLVLGTDGKYHTAEESYWQVWNSGEANPETWYVRTKDGSLYTFDARMSQWMCSGEDCEPCYGEYEHYKWLLTQAQDVHGNTITYEYEYETPVSCRGTTMYQAVYLRRITYNGGLVEIEFDRTAREDLYAPGNASRYPFKFQQNTKLDTIQVKVGGELVREYRLTYDYSTEDDDGDLFGWETQEKLTLRGVELCGTKDGGSTFTCLPMTRFGYYPMWSGGELQVGRNRLMTATNGYGGVVTYTYEVVTEINEWRNRVVERAVDDGMGSVAIWSYEYSEAQRNSPWITNTVCQGLSYDAGTESPRTRPVQEVRGHETVTVTGPLGNVQVHTYDQGDTFRGKETQAVYRDGAGNTYQYVTRDYGVIPTATALDQGGYTFAWPEIAFTYLFTETTFICDESAPCRSRATVNYYDSELQGGAQYGNLTRVEEYDDGGTLYRTTQRRYAPNTTAWIVGAVAQEALYEGTTAPENWRSLTHYAYDGQAPFVPPAVGDLTRIMRAIDLDGNYWATTVDTAYGYDGYGNRISETVFNDWGGCYAGPGGGYSPATGDPRTTTIEYDVSEAGFHLYPERVTYPNGRSETATYSYTHGLLLSHTDANEDTTAYRYDALGRVVGVIRPGDDAAYPTVAVSYQAFGQPGSQHVRVQQRESWHGGTIDTERFFDGLGRAIQVHSEAEGSQEIIATTLFDPLGQVAAKVSPFLYAGSAATYLSPPQDQPRTRYAYDPLGRTIVVTQTDGTEVRSYYDRWRTAALDANRHLRVQEADAFGRMVRVEEYTGTVALPFDWGDLPPLYATTLYGYDVRDQLAAVTDTVGNETHILYDRLGRKTAMDDPDMGYWTYGYDPLGRMITQTDALGQVLTFDYDDMGRMVLKDLPGDWPDVHLCYDGCGDGGEADVTNSWGRLRRTWVGDDDTLNGHSYRYDERGRTVSDTVWLGGAGYTTRYSYDSMDRPVAMTYPDGEVVTTAYNAQGMPSSLDGEGDTHYVAGAGYNERGQTTLLSFGNALQTTYLYDDGPLPSYRLEEIRTRGDSTELQRLWYEYDDAGNVIEIRDYKARSPYQELTFGYDPLDRLVSAGADGSEAEGGYGPFSYSYDPIGNLLSKEGASYTYPAPGQPRPHAVSSVEVDSQVITYTYDANGNMTAGKGREIEWDPENRPVAVTLDGETTTFVYGPEGGRVKVVEPDGTYTLYVGAHYERTIDPSAPQVEERAPYPGQTDFPVNGMIKVRFSEAVVTGTFTLTNLSSQQAVAGTLGPLLDEGEVVGVRFTPTADLELVTPYRVEVAGFSDPLGNPQQPDPETWAFATQGVDYSDAPGLYPLEAAWHAPGAQPWRLGSTVTYSEANACYPPEDDDGVSQGGQNPADDRFEVLEGSSAQMQVTVGGPLDQQATVSAWVDWAGSGLFGTLVYNSTVPGGVYGVSFAVPEGSCQEGPVAMRWRIGESGGGPLGAWAGGEVEDYLLDVRAVPPQVMAASPSGANVPLEVVPVVVTMSEAVQCPLDADCGPHVTDLRGGTALSGTTGVDGAVVSFTPTEALSECSPYVGTVEHWADVCGAGMGTAHSWNWYTVAIPPEVLAVSPGVSATEVPLDSVIVVTMSEAMSYPDIQGAGCGITLKRLDNGWVIPGETEIAGSTIVFTPVIALPEYSDYEATAQGFVDSCGAAMGVYTWTFQTIKDPPRVTATVPLGGELCVPLGTALRVTFTQEVTSAVGPEFSLGGPGGEVTGTAGFVRPPGVQSEHFWAWSAYFTPSQSLAEKALYEAAVWGVVDRSGLPMEEPHRWGFRSLDLTAPAVVSTEPAAEAPDGYPDEPLTAWYDEEVSWPDQVQRQGNHFTLEGPGGTVEGTVDEVTGLDGRSGIRFSPAGLLEEQARYTATIAGAVDLCGNASLTHTWSFSTACLLRDPQYGVPVEPVLVPGACTREEASFKVTEVPSGTVSGYEWVILAANGYDLITTVVTVEPTLTHTLPEPGEVRWVKVRGRDAAGCVSHWSMARELSWEGCYPGAPQVAEVGPLPGSTDVTVTAVLTLTFNEVVYAPDLTVDDLAEVLLQAGSAFVPGQWKYAERYDEEWAWGARFTPTTRLGEKTWHYGIVTGMKDSHGHRMQEPYSWAFRTGDYSPPVVVETVPPDDPQGNDGVSIDVVLAAEFDELLDEERLGEVEFALTGPSGPVSGTVALADAATGAQSVLRFTPDNLLEMEARYTATVVGAVDLSGNVMVEPHAWVFHTGEGGGGIHSGGAERVRKYYAFRGKPVALREELRGESVVFWLHPDHLGSTSLVTDDTGQKEAERRYLPWGETRYEDTGEVHTGRLYTGQIKDDSTGLYYYNARYYDAWLARFVSADTIVPNAADPQSLNRFSYVRNNPLGRIDPSGCVDCSLLGDSDDVLACEYTTDHRARGEEYINGAWQYTGNFDLGEYDYSSTSYSARTAMIYAYARYLADKGMGGSEALARITEYAAALYAPGMASSDEGERGRAMEGFMTGISDVIVGWSGRGISGIAFLTDIYGGSVGRNEFWLGKPNVYGNDFAEAYDDKSLNQPYHFWFYVASAYWDGSATATWGNEYHDPASSPPAPRSDGITREDYNLGVKGIELGAQLATGSIDISQVGAWIRSNLQKP